MNDGIRYFYGVVLLALGVVSIVGVVVLASQGKEIPPILAASLGTVLGSLAALIPPGRDDKR